MTMLKPKVFRKYGRQRLGRGFSREELTKAGLNLREALKLGIRIDVRRRTAHSENVEVLKKFLQNKKEAQAKSES